MENKHRNYFDWCTFKQTYKGHNCWNKLRWSR